MRGLWSDLMARHLLIQGLLQDQSRKGLPVCLPLRGHSPEMNPLRCDTGEKQERRTYGLEIPVAYWWVAGVEIFESSSGIFDLRVQ